MARHCTVVLMALSFVTMTDRHHELHVLGIWSAASVPTEYREAPDKTFVSVSHSLDLSEAPIQI